MSSSPGFGALSREGSSTNITVTTVVCLSAALALTRFALVRLACLPAANALVTTKPPEENMEEKAEVV